MTVTPIGPVSLNTWRMVPSLPAVSTPCSTTSSARLPFGEQLVLQVVDGFAVLLALVLRDLAVREGRGVGGIAPGQMRALAGRDAELGARGLGH